MELDSMYDLSVNGNVKDIRIFFEIVGYINFQIEFFGYKKILENNIKLFDYLCELCKVYGVEYGMYNDVENIRNMCDNLDNKFMDMLNEKFK